MVALTSVLWVFAGILSPFLTFCSYDLLKKRFDWLASPYLVTPSVVGASILAFEFTFATPQGIVSAHYDHFLFAGIFLLSCYGFLGWLQYSNVDSLVLSIMTLFAIDELWQTPYNVANWTQSLWAFQVGISTAAWNLMSIPFAFYFVKRINGRIRFDYLTSVTFYAAAMGTAMGTAKLVFDPYWLIIPWFIFFIALYRSSRRGISSPSITGGVDGGRAGPKVPPPSKRLKVYQIVRNPIRGLKVRLNVKLGDKTMFSVIKDKPNATPERLKEVEKEIQEEYARNRFTRGFTVEVIELKE